MAKKPQRELWVVKAGSQMVISGGPLLIRHWMQQVAALNKDFGIQVVWVSSGAIASARFKTGNHKKRIEEKQALSAIGQPLVMDAYNLALQTLGRLGAQVLLTYDDLKNRKRRSNLHNTLKTLLKWQVVPILNENDTVSTEEIQFGDNDNLSAKVACMLGADRLIMMTDVDGLYDKNPKTHTDAKLRDHVPKLTSRLLQEVDRSSSSVGSGGMYSKLCAAQTAQKQGIPTHLFRGDTANGLLALARGQNLGTLIGRGPR